MHPPDITLLRMRYAWSYDSSQELVGRGYCLAATQPIKFTEKEYAPKFCDLTYDDHMQNVSSLRFRFELS